MLFSIHAGLKVETCSFVNTCYSMIPENDKKPATNLSFTWSHYAKYSHKVFTFLNEVEMMVFQKGQPIRLHLSFHHFQKGLLIETPKVKRNRTF